MNQPQQLTLFGYLGEPAVNQLKFETPMHHPARAGLPRKLGDFTATESRLLATKITRDAQYIRSHGAAMEIDTLEADAAALEADAKQLRDLADAMDPREAAGQTPSHE
jgi:hypothetical protein